MEFQRGDHLRVRRRGYWHHGIYCGDNVVVHYSGEREEKRDARVRATTLEAFAKGGDVEVTFHPAARGAEDVAARAESCVGESRYHLMRNNCEHFAYWCKTGSRRSGQVRRALTMGAAAGLAMSSVAVVVAREAIRARRRRRHKTG